MGITIKRALQACRDSFVAVGIFSGVANILMLVPAFYMLNIYDKAVGNNSLDTLWVLSAITIAMFLMLALMEIIRSRVLVEVAARLDRLVSPALYDLSFENAVRVGGERSSTQPLIDLNGLRQFLTGNGVFAFFDAPWLPVYLWVMFMFHPMLGWLGVASALLFLCIAAINQLRSSAPLAEASELWRLGNAETEKNLRNSEAVVSMGMLPEIRERWRSRQDLVLERQGIASNKAGFYNSIIKTLRLAVQSAAIAAGAYLVLRQEISPGMLIAGSILIGRALAPVESAVGAWKGFVDAREQYRRLETLLEHNTPEADPMDLPAISGQLTARRAALTPPGSRVPTVAGVSFEMPAGNVCMILGHSGSGKSTLVRGILGLWPTSAGEIRIDGSETFKLRKGGMGRQVGYLPQDIELLDGSIAQNIARFGPIDSESVIQAAQDAGLHEFIQSLPNGYDTVIGGSGGTLSPGQRQRIALARAVYLRPALVVLDEPNSNLDDAGEAALQVAIETLKNNSSTVMVVSHRTRLLPLADFVLVMESGTVKAFGPTDTVIQGVQRAQVAPQVENGEPKSGQKIATPAIARTVPVAPPILKKKPGDDPAT